jgi:hypothetical protein
MDIIDIDLTELSEDLRDEAERVIHMSASALLQKFFVPNEHAVVGVKEESKPFIRELVRLMTGFVPAPGVEYVFYIKLGVDDKGVPVHHTALTRNDEEVTAQTVTRFINHHDLYIVAYENAYRSLAEKLRIEDGLEMGNIVSRDFTLCSQATRSNLSVFFAVTLN